MGDKTNWGKVVALLLGAAAVGGGLYLILKPEKPELGFRKLQGVYR